MTTLMPAIAFCNLYDERTSALFLSPGAFRQFGQLAIELAETLYNSDSTANYACDAWVRVLDGSKVLERWEIGVVSSADLYQSQLPGSDYTKAVELEEQTLSKLDKLVASGFESNRELVLARAMSLFSGLNDVISLGCKISVDVPPSVLAALPAIALTTQEVDQNRARRRLPKLDSARTQIHSTKS